MWAPGHVTASGRIRILEDGAEIDVDGEVAYPPSQPVVKAGVESKRVPHLLLDRSRAPADFGTITQQLLVIGRRLFQGDARDVDEVRAAIGPKVEGDRAAPRGFVAHHFQG
jgi:hypothetical protein